MGQEIVNRERARPMLGHIFNKRDLLQGRTRTGTRCSRSSVPPPEKNVFTVCTTKSKYGSHTLCPATGVAAC